MSLALILLIINSSLLGIGLLVYLILYCREHILGVQTTQRDTNTQQHPFQDNQPDVNHTNHTKNVNNHYPDSMTFDALKRLANEYQPNLTMNDELSERIAQVAWDRDKIVLLLETDKLFIIVPSSQDQTRKALICTFDLSGNFLAKLKAAYLQSGGPDFSMPIPGKHSLSIVNMNENEPSFETFIIQGLQGYSEGSFYFQASLLRTIPNFAQKSDDYTSFVSTNFRRVLDILLHIVNRRRHNWEADRMSGDLFSELFDTIKSDPAKGLKVSLRVAFDERVHRDKFYIDNQTYYPLDNKKVTLIKQLLASDHLNDTSRLSGNIVAFVLSPTLTYLDIDKTHLLFSINPPSSLKKKINATITHANQHHPQPLDEDKKQDTINNSDSSIDIEYIKLVFPYESNKALWCNKLVIQHVPYFDTLIKHASSTAYQNTKRDPETGLVTVTIEHHSSKEIKNLLIGLIYEPKDLLAKYKRLRFTDTLIKHTLLNLANIVEHFSQLYKSDALKHIARQINPQSTTHHNTASNWFRPRQSNNPSSQHLQNAHQSSNTNYIFT